MKKDITTLDGKSLVLNNETVVFTMFVSNDGKEFYHTLLRSGDILDILENPFDESPVPPPPPVPEGYTQLKAIITSGHHRLSTPFKATSDMIFYIDADITKGSSGISGYQNSKTIFAKSYSGGSHEYENPESNKFFLLYDEGCYDDPVEYDIPNREHLFCIDYYNKLTKCDDIVKPFTREVTAITGDYPFCIGVWQEDGSMYYESYGTFYRVAIVKGSTDEMLINLVPAMRDEDKEIGMYDFTKKEFIMNDSGEGKLGYIEMDGTKHDPS